MSRHRRFAIAALSGLGLADALYMLAYEEGLIDSLVCPFFGEGCNVVGRSAHARHFGVPNAAVGAVGYAAMAVLALWPGRRRSSALAAIAGAAVAASAFLTWEQPARVGAWCFWCLTSAGLNVLVFPLALMEFRASVTDGRVCHGTTANADPHHGERRLLTGEG